jgi:hypothetical protein
MAHSSTGRRGKAPLPVNGVIFERRTALDHQTHEAPVQQAAARGGVDCEEQTDHHPAVSSALIQDPIAGGGGERRVVCRYNALLVVALDLGIR